ncbi:tripartite tricarboxylate transporter substrate-binding protein [Agrococcus sp. ARC_14]|uniref:Bug family tripartite tricarboxylate transporter substrate binding protein n=1 Tax=Agrococcus sp. ARC_14 TaxID=2919927 RepID=UPI001F063376|nr:tripartite tricarboxylate transporter substrate-binding protein [Agrococcus sp. ARC_14]MCH1883963.1 tripartite tricarboxylate transporter substrate binding protein [Agrococcus sp. ARC_14]
MVTEEQPTGKRKRIPHAVRLVIGAVASVAMIATLVVTGIEQRSSAASGYDAALGGRQLSIMAPANPGGGWDQTSRAVQASLADIVGRSEVYNVGGAGGTIGLPQFVRHSGEANELMVTGAIMVGAILTNESEATLEDVDMLARLSTEYLVVAVPSSSPIQTMEELGEAMATDVGSVSIAGGSAGGVEQVLAGLIGQAVGADPAEVSYVAHSGGGEALTTMLSGSSVAGISGISELAPYIADGSMRALAVSSPEELDTLPGVPSLRETGIDVELENWRGIAAPLGLEPEERAALVAMLDEMHASETWNDILQQRGWSDAYLTGPDLEAFVDSEQRTTQDVLRSIGLVD